MKNRSTGLLQNCNDKNSLKREKFKNPFLSRGCTEWRGFVAEI
jgi:hypothetical protein